MQLKLSWKTALGFSIKMCFNGANILISNNWNENRICKNKINKLIKYFIQKTMKLTVI